MKKNIAKNIVELIGNTPMLSLSEINKNFYGEIIAKLEFFNPLSSVKDRVALSMIEALEKEKKIKKGDTLIEATSGNTGIGLAYICAVKGYNLVLTMPESMSIERRKLLKAFGVSLILTPKEKGMNGAIEKVAQLVKEKGFFHLNQFENKNNPLIHKKTTAKEILRDTNGEIDFFIAGVGTGGTISGVGEVLKKFNKNIKIIAVEPQNSAVLSGKSAGSHKIQGIGAGFIPKNLNLEIIDEIITVTDEEAFLSTKELAQKEGLLVGISSGAIFSAAKKIASKKENKDKKIVVIFPDTGERYLSTELF